MIKRSTFFIILFVIFFPITILACQNNNLNTSFPFYIALKDNIIDKDLLEDEFNEYDDVNNENSYEIWDPFEPINRKFLDITLWLDKIIINKIDIGYKYIIPPFVRHATVNMVNNFNEPLNAANHLLQFKFISFIQVMSRFVLNTTLGFLGIVDIASTLNIPPNPNDFGYTLTYYYIGNGFYIFVPILGPYTFKTGLATITSSLAYSKVLNRMVDLNYIYIFLIEGSSKAIFYLENRSSLVELLSTSIDSYSLMKSAYIQNRKFNFEKLKHSW